jgi:hypothetical protein
MGTDVHTALRQLIDHRPVHPACLTDLVDNDKERRAETCFLENRQNKIKLALVAVIKGQDDFFARIARHLFWF